MIRHGSIQPLLDGLRSHVARDAVQGSLAASFREAVVRRPAVAVSFSQIASRGFLGRSRSIRNTSLEVPKADCTLTDKCTIGAANCETLRDRFLLIAAGIQDQQLDLKQKLADLGKTCQEQEDIIRVQSVQINSRLRKEQTALAEATGQNIKAKEGSRAKNSQYDGLKVDHAKMEQDCCSTQNDVKREKCALRKIRSQLYKLQGREGDFEDCTTSEWHQEECSVSCGGGTRRFSRQRVTPQHGGTACGPLAKVEPCNEHACPVDCSFAAWEEWSSCSAGCDGGVKERVRRITQEAENGGLICAETSEAVPCNVQACSNDCVLAVWTEWTSCSKACDTGSQRRWRDVEKEAAALGKCPHAEAKERLQFKPCNEKDCQELLPGNRTLLRCASALDVVVLLDGSGSMGRPGWQAARAFAARLISRLEGGDDKVLVALQMFSGPANFDAYERCTSDDPNIQPDMAKDCGITWVKRLTGETAEVSRMVPNLEWPAGSTFLSAALEEAQGELQFGRSNASSLVIVITDGAPISARRTQEAAKRLKEKARILWVPIGSSPPMELIEGLAGLPHKDNVVPARSFEELEDDQALNALLASACPVLS